jgi:hypothetical protein
MNQGRSRNPWADSRPEEPGNTTVPHAALSHHPDGRRFIGGDVADYRIQLGYDDFNGALELQAAGSRIALNYNGPGPKVTAPQFQFGAELITEIRKNGLG